MKPVALIAIAGALSLAAASNASAQTSGAMAPATNTVVTPVAPPGVAVARVGPGMFVVTPVPGIAAATTIKVQNFSDYDLNKDGVYNPMEFAQALYFLATSDPVAGNPKLPAADRFYQKGAWQKMRPENAVALLNATADELAAVDLNHDWRVSPAELTASALM
jgi:hypothetical protein